MRTTNNWLFLSSSTFISNKFPTTRQALIKICAMQFVWFFSSVQDSWQRRKIETCQKYRTQRGLITAVELKAVQLWSEIIVWLGTGAVILKHSQMSQTHTHIHTASWKELKLIRKGPLFCEICSKYGKSISKKVLLADS